MYFQVSQYMPYDIYNSYSSLTGCNGGVNSTHGKTEEERALQEYRENQEEVRQVYLRIWWNWLPRSSVWTTELDSCHSVVRSYRQRKLISNSTGGKKCLHKPSDSLFSVIALHGGRNKVVPVHARKARCRLTVNITHRSLYPWGKEPGTYWTGVWMDIAAGMDVLVERNISRPCRDSNPISPVVVTILTEIFQLCFETAYIWVFHVSQSSNQTCLTHTRRREVSRATTHFISQLFQLS